MARKPIITADWMRIREAAAQLDCHPQTVLNRINAGTISGVRVIRIERVVRLHRGDWAAYLDRNAFSSQQQLA